MYSLLLYIVTVTVIGKLSSVNVGVSNEQYPDSMAVYRYMELDKIGFWKNRVLKPPVSGSSNISVTSEVVEQSPRRVCNNQYLQLVFATIHMSKTPVTPCKKPGNDLHNCLFGAVESQPHRTSRY
jgi:hypothetical protein